MSSTKQPREASRDFVVPQFGALHGRPTMLFVDVARRYASDLVLECDGEKYDCKSFFQVLTAQLVEGKAFTVRAYGDDCIDALDAIGQALRDIAMNDYGR